MKQISGDSTNISSSDLEEIISIISKGGATPAQIAWFVHSFKNLPNDILAELICGICARTKHCNDGIDICVMSTQSHSVVPLLCAAIIVASCGFKVSISCSNIVYPFISIWDIAYKMKLLGKYNEYKDIKFVLPSLVNDFVRCSAFIFKEFQFSTIMDFVVPIVNFCDLKIIVATDDSIFPILNKYVIKFKRPIKAIVGSRVYLLDEFGSKFLYYCNTYASIKPSSNVDLYIKKVFEVLSGDDSVYTKASLEYAAHAILGTKDWRTSFELVSDALYSGSALMYLK